jgi:glycosyltransferase involved in cell wall biosynthesis
MRILFEPIGVLVHYNFALPHYLSRLAEVTEIHLLAGLFPIIMGGHYYISRSSRRKLKIILYRSGVDFFDKFDFSNMFENDTLKYVIQKCHQQIDIIHLNTTEHLNVFTKLKIPKLFVLHGSPDYIDEHGCKALEDVCSKVEAFVVVSFYAARMLREKCDFEPTHVIHHGVDIELFNPLTYTRDHARRLLGFPLNKKIILWNARLSPEKKIETLLYALPYVIKEFKDILVIIKTRAIDKVYEIKTKKIINRLNLSMYVILDKGWTPLNNMPAYYRAADIYINTSTTEAFGSLTMLEAMACGIPTIANNASSNPEALGDGGFLYNTNDPNDLAEKILRVLTDDKLAKKLSYKAYKRIKKELTLTNIVKKYVELYSSLTA